MDLVSALNLMFRLNIHYTGLLFCAILVFSGCAPGLKARRGDRDSAIRDVAAIVKKYDCPAACEVLKAYIKSQIGEAIK